MQPLERSQPIAGSAVIPPRAQSNIMLAAHQFYPAQLKLANKGDAVLWLQNQTAVQSIVLKTQLPLPAAVPLQLSFSERPTGDLKVQVRQWQGTAQVVALSPAQTQFLQQANNLPQLAQQLAKGEAINQLAGEAFKLNKLTQPAQVNLVTLPQTLVTLAASQHLMQLTQSQLYQSLPPTVQPLLLQPDQQVALLQQLQTKANLLQLSTVSFTLTNAQRQQLQTLLTPIVTQFAQAQLANSAGLLFVQPLKMLPDILLSHASLATSIQLIPTETSTTKADTAAMLASLRDNQNIDDSNLNKASSSVKAVLSSLKEDFMKAVNLDKLFVNVNLTADSNNLKLQPGAAYFAKLQLNSLQHAQLIVQTAQGAVKLELAKALSIPTDTPLQIQLQAPQADILELDIKVLTQLPHMVILSKAQAALLQDPKQLFLLQQRIMRGETITQVAGEPLKLPAMDAKSLHLSLLPPLDNAAAKSNGATQGWQLSIQPINSEQKLRLASSDFIKPIPFVAQIAEAKPSYSTPTESSQLAWRQLLPLLDSTPAALRSMPEMPAAVQQMLALLRQTQPDGKTLLSPTQVVEQLQASLQFQPLQAQPNMATAAGTLAVAIQLLLGHLLRQPLSASKDSAAQRLAQTISQLDPQQSKELLRALGSHSSALQLAQLQNADTASVQQHWLIPLALQQQQESRLSQILIEQKAAENKDKNAKDKYWQLTMKFDLGNMGQLMAVAKLQESDVQLQFYTNEPHALHQAEKFLPLLTERCLAQGINVSKTQCQLGKIPETLGNRRTSLISTKA
ncbi:flagellar hook-length control protein FliK [Alishewanella sp. d11]|uniref:flagellar hook-length control protein FliK n=1 Tax=Alishewanella sp. d11 TaxID=3414030 RepID=UPI003BF87DE8